MEEGGGTKEGTRDILLYDAWQVTAKVLHEHVSILSKGCDKETYWRCVCINQLNRIFYLDTNIQIIHVVNFVNSLCRISGYCILISRQNIQIRWWMQTHLSIDYSNSSTSVAEIHWYHLLLMAFEKSRELPHSTSMNVTLVCPSARTTALTFSFR